MRCGSWASAFEGRPAGHCACRRWSASLSHGVSFQLELVGIVDGTVEDRVGESRVTDDVMPFVDGKLAGDEHARVRTRSHGVRGGLRRRCGDPTETLQRQRGFRIEPDR